MERGGEVQFTIEQARKVRGFTQEQIAKHLGMSRSNYIEYEQGKRFFRVDQAYKFSKATNLSLNDIIFYEECEKEDS